jgi:hypothetical protein
VPPPTGLTLAQLAPPGSRNPLASVERLPGTPLPDRWLYETPWTPAVLLAVAGMIAALLLARAARPRAGALAVTLALTLAAGLVALAHSVKTPRELLIDRTRALVAAVLGADANRLQRELSPTFTLTLLGRQSARGKDHIVQQVRADIAQRFGAKASELRWVRATIDGPTSARTQASVLATSDLLGSPTPTVWMLYWRADAQGQWLLSRLEAQEIGLFTSVPDP